MIWTAAREGFQVPAYHLGRQPGRGPGWIAEWQISERKLDEHLSGQFRG